MSCSSNKAATAFGSKVLDLVTSDAWVNSLLVVWMRPALIYRGPDDTHQNKYCIKAFKVAVFVSLLSDNRSPPPPTDPLDLDFIVNMPSSRGSNLLFRAVLPLLPRDQTALGLPMPPLPEKLRTTGSGSWPRLDYQQAFLIFTDSLLGPSG